MQTLKVCQTFNKVLTVHQEVEKENVTEHAHIYTGGHGDPWAYDRFN